MASRGFGMFEARSYADDPVPLRAMWAPGGYRFIDIAVSSLPVQRPRRAASAQPAARTTGAALLVQRPQSGPAQRPVTASSHADVRRVNSGCRTCSGPPVEKGGLGNRKKIKGAQEHQKVFERLTKTPEPAPPLPPFHEKKVKLSRGQQSKFLDRLHYDATKSQQEVVEGCGRLLRVVGDSRGCGGVRRGGRLCGGVRRLGSRFRVPAR